MSAQPSVQLKGRAPQPEDPAVTSWINEQRIKSVDNLEAAGRQLITLSTGLLGVVFTLTAIAGNPLPRYMLFPSIRLVSGLAVFGFLLSTVFALLVLWPFPTTMNMAEPGAQARGLADILARKQRFLQFAVVGFGGGIGFFALAIVLAFIVVV